VVIEGEMIYSLDNPPTEFRPYFGFLGTVPIERKPYYDFEEYLKDWIVYDELEDLISSDAYEHYCNTAKERGMLARSDVNYNVIGSFSRVLGNYARNFNIRSISTRLPNGNSQSFFPNLSIKNLGRYSNLFDKLFEYQEDSRLLSSDYMMIIPNDIGRKTFVNKLSIYFKKKGVLKTRSSLKTKGKSEFYTYYPNYRIRS
jgi:hypothetical protein